MKKVLHITNWYPNKWNDIEAIFIKEQFDLFSKVTDARLVHVEVRYDKNSWLRTEVIKYSDKETGFYIHTRIRNFRIIELLTYHLLLKALKKQKYQNFDLLHFHVSYPLLTYYHWLKNKIKLPIVLSEHWSAFHYNFYMPKTTKKLDRIKNIFKHKIPLITVSRALLNDIYEFSGEHDFPSKVIPNVIDYSVYKFMGKKHRNCIPHFFIVNYWREIKNPIPMLEAFASLNNENIEFRLEIGGYGGYLNIIKSYVDKLNLQDKVDFTGKMNKQQIAESMNNADVYLFSSNYETFSAVCAQALCCGCPLIGPAIPAIQEYAGSQELIVLESNDKKGWEKAIRQFLLNKRVFNRAEISANAIKFLSHERINQRYLSFIQ